MRISTECRGSASVEFALVAPVLLLMLVFIMELGYDLFAQEALDYGLQVAARAIQIGRAQGINTAADFRNKYFCPAVNMWLPCTAVSVNVQQVLTDYFQAGNNWGVPLNQSGQLDLSGFTYCPGQPNSLMRVQAIYTAPTALGMLVPAMATSTSNGAVHVTVSSVAFINENFPVTSAPPVGC